MGTVEAVEELGKKSLLSKCPIRRDPDGTPYICDVTTSNLSFIQTASDLAHLGVKNNMFFLKLYDQDLLGVDPFSQTITVEQIGKIMLECMLNPYYFLRECVRVPEQGGGTGVGSGSPFILHRGNLAAAWCFLNNIDFYLVIPRQCFKTMSVLALLDWAYLFGTTNSSFNFTNKTQKDADDNLRKFKDMKALLPLYMQQKFKYIQEEYSLSSKPGDLKVFKGLDNVRCLVNPINNNRIESKPSARTEEAADGIGRGNSAPIQLYDEVEFTQYIATILKAAGPAYVRAAENAARNGAMFGRILITTPGDADSAPVKTTNTTRKNAGKFSDHLYDKSMDCIKNEWMPKFAKNRIIYIEFSYKQIGMDEVWYQKMVAILEFDKLKVKREILLQRVRGTSNSPFDPDDLDTMAQFAKPPIKEIPLFKIFTLLIYEELDATIPYIMGVDCATGTNGDSTVTMILNPYTLKPAALMDSALSDAMETSKLIVKIVSDYIPLALIAVESNHLGQAILSILKTTRVKNNLYYDKDKVYEPGREEKISNHGFAVIEAENRRYWGIFTGTDSRAIMMQLLIQRVKNNKQDFVSSLLVDSITTLVYNSQGKIVAANGEHDDVVMAYLIALYVYFYGTKLTRYGIIKGMTQSLQTKLEKKESYEDIYAAMPDHMKEMFPAPNAPPIASAASSDIGYAGGILGASEGQRREVDAWREQMQLAAKRRISTSDGSIVTIEKNIDPTEEMYDPRTERPRSSNMSRAIDLCKLFDD